MAVPGAEVFVEFASGELYVGFGLAKVYKSAMVDVCAWGFFFADSQCQLTD